MHLTSPPRHLTETQALAAYRAVIADLAEVFGYDLTPLERVLRQGQGDDAWFAGPVLVEDFSMWHSETAWAVVWDGGPTDWVHYVHPALPAGVGCDAFASFALSLFPEEA